VQLVGRARIELEVAGACRHVGASLRERLAAIACLEQHQFIGVIGDRSGDARETSAALDRRELAPRTVARVLCRLHGEIDVSGAAACNRRERAAIRRIDHRQRCAVARGDEAVADEMPRRDGDGWPAGVGSVHGVA